MDWYLGMQCKHIPTIPILVFLRDKPWGPHNVPGCNFWPEQACLFESDVSRGWSDNSIMRVMPKGIPTNLLKAKLRKLIKQKLIDGCCCGYSGNFDITDQGEFFIEASAMVAQW